MCNRITLLNNLYFFGYHVLIAFTEIPSTGIGIILGSVLGVLILSAATIILCAAILCLVKEGKYTSIIYFSCTLDATN